MSSTPIPLHSRGPDEIPAGAAPFEKQIRVTDALHAAHPGRIWLCKDAPHWLTDEGYLKPLPLPRLRSLVPEVAVLRTGKSTDDDTLSRIPRQIVDDAFHHPDFAESIQGVRRCPWVDADGELHVTPGRTGDWLLYWPHEEAHPDLVTNDEMFDIIDRLLDFEFLEECDRIAYLGLLLRTVCPLVGHASPLTLISATTPACGKSFAAELVGLILEGAKPSSVTPKEGKELGYSIAAWTRAELPLVWIDNLRTGTEVGDPELHALLTATGRVLARQVKSSDLDGGDPTRSIWMMTGNQITLDEEQARRTVMVRLKRRAKDRPWRTPDLLGWVEANRRRVVSALLRFSIEWIRRGSRDPDRTLSSYREWSRRIGGPISEMYPEGRGLWLSEASRPAPPDHLAWDRLFSDHWPRHKKTGRLEVLRTSKVLALVDEGELGALQKFAGSGSERGRSTTFAKTLIALSNRDEEAPILGRWHLRRKLGGRPGYWPEWVGPPTEVTPRDDLSDPPDPGRTSETQASRGQVRPVRPVIPDPKGPPYPPQSSSSVPSPTGLTGLTEHGGGRILDGRPHFERSTEVRRASVELPEGDLGEGHLEAVANRGIRVDPDLWSAATDEAEDDLAFREDQESIERLRGVRAYGSSVWAQAQADPEDRIRSDWENQPTGRLGTVRPNIQGFTKSYGLRRAVIPAEGHRFLIGDYIGAHLTIAASLSRDVGLIGAIGAGGIYEAAAEIWAPELGSAGRKASKLATLSTINGAGPQRLQCELAEFGVEVTAPEAKRRREAWLEQYPSLAGWLTRTRGIRDFETPLGRRVQLPDEAEDYKSISWHLLAVEADALRLVLRRYTGRIVLLVHDEVVAEEPTDTADAMAEELRSAMDSAMAKALGRRTLGMTTCVVDVRDTWAKPPKAGA